MYVCMYVCMYVSIYVVFHLFIITEGNVFIRNPVFSGAALGALDNGEIIFQNFPPVRIHLIFLD